jgi:hypothetical protein
MVRLRLVLLVLLTAHVGPWVAPCLVSAPASHGAMACCHRSEPKAPAARPCCAPAGQPPATAVTPASTAIHALPLAPLPAMMTLVPAVQRMSVPAGAAVPLLPRVRSTVLLI